MIEYVVKVYLILLTISALVVFLALVSRRWYNRKRGVAISPAPTMFLREAFHFLVGAIILILFNAKLMTPVAALAVSALLLIGFEYAVVISRKLRL